MAAVAWTLGSAEAVWVCMQMAVGEHNTQTVDPKTVESKPNSGANSDSDSVLYVQPSSDAESGSQKEPDSKSDHQGGPLQQNTRQKRHYYMSRKLGGQN